MAGWDAVSVADDIGSFKKLVKAKKTLLHVYCKDGECAYMCVCVCWYKCVSVSVADDIGSCKKLIKTKRRCCMCTARMVSVRMYVYVCVCVCVCVCVYKYVSVSAADGIGSFKKLVIAKKTLLHVLLQG